MHAEYNELHQNFIHIKVEEGKQTDLKEKFWKIEFAILWRVGEGELNSAELVFLVRQKDWQLQENSIVCSGNF